MACLWVWLADPAQLAASLAVLLAVSLAALAAFIVALLSLYCFGILGEFIQCNVEATWIA